MCTTTVAVARIWMAGGGLLSNRVCWCLLSGKSNSQKLANTQTNNNIKLSIHLYWRIYYEVCIIHIGLWTVWCGYGYGCDNKEVGEWVHPHRPGAYGSVYFRCARMILIGFWFRVWYDISATRHQISMGLLGSHLGRGLPFSICL